MNDDNIIGQWARTQRIFTEHVTCDDIMSAHVVEFAESQNRQQHTKYHQSTQYVKTSNLCLQDLNLCLQHVWNLHG